MRPRPLGPVVRGGRRPARCALALALLTGVLGGCGGSGPTAPATASTAPPAEGQAGGGTVTADLRDALLSKHNARFFGNRTFRWVPPIPIHVLIGDPELDAFFLAQFRSWEPVLGIGSLYQPLPVPDELPARGVFLVIDDLPGNFLATGDAFALGERRSGRVSLARRARQLARPAPVGRRELPEILASGAVQRCLVTLDPLVLDLNDDQFALLLRHEVGHCLGFLDHVPQGLMKATCCDGGLTVTADVRTVLRKLYRLPPGTAVTR